jgi:aminoglycoside phosphotransferase family enzyme
VPLPEKVAFLSEASHYPGLPDRVLVRETHMSWVFLAGDLVYKLKKPVRFPYLDFSTLRRREAACRAEFSLNLRLAPDIYLGVVPLTETDGVLSIDGKGRVIDWLVVMRRLADDGSLESAIQSGRVSMRDADRIADRLSTFYRHARRVAIRPDESLADWRAMLAYNRRILRDPRFGLPAGQIERILRIQRRFLAEEPGVLKGRVRQRRIVEAHGDLRPEHIWLGNPVTVIDCLEFDKQMRCLDPLDEVAFLHLECQRLGAGWVGERIYRQLARDIADPRETGLYLFYRSCRALLRARLAIAHLLDSAPRTPEKWPRRAREYLAFAEQDAVRLERLLNRRRGRPGSDVRAGGRSLQRKAAPKAQ